MRTFARFWNEEHGAILSAEVMLVGTLLVIGVIVGLKSVRDSVVSELADVAQAVDNTSQGYWYGGSNNNNNYGGNSGASFNDSGSNNGGGQSSSCVSVYAAAQGEE